MAQRANKAALAVADNGFKLATGGAVNKLIDTIAADLGAVDQNVHEAGVQTVAHVEKHGDWTLLKRLILVLRSSGYRVQGVRAWIEGHSPIRFPADKAADGGFTVKVLKEGEDGFVPFNIEGMIATPFTAYEPSNERVGQPVYAGDLVGGINRTRQRFLKLVENTNNDGSPKDPAKPYYRGDIGKMLAYLTALDAIVEPNDPAKAEDDKAAQRAAESALIQPVSADPTGGAAAAERAKIAA